MIICANTRCIDDMNYIRVREIHNEINAKLEFKKRIFSDHYQGEIFKISPKLAHKFIILFLLSSNMLIEKVTKNKNLKIEYFTRLVCIFFNFKFVYAINNGQK